MGISKNGGNWHLEGFLCYFTCLNLIFVKILGNFQLGHHYYCLTVTGHMLATTSSYEYAKWPTLDYTMQIVIKAYDLKKNACYCNFI
jgi:hypothetical protein